MKNLRARFAVGLTILAMAILPRPAAAVDGVTEINQARALAGGVTGSDTLGFPVFIDTNGSYRLTSNLTVDENTVAIEVLASAKEVTIDLNGFAIVGPVTCPGLPPVCSGSGTGVGIHAADTATRVEVSNGTIRGMGSHGIYLAGGGSIEHVRSGENAGDGINLGINFFGNSLVKDSTASSNGGTGISTSAYSVVVNDIAVGNAVDGIATATGCTIAGNTTIANGRNGIRTASSTVLDNAIRLNSSYGLFSINSSNLAGYARNVLTVNNSAGDGTQVSSGIQIGPNQCNSALCP